jgi:N-acetylmuramic acid 6-phosphate etherase
MILLGRVYRGLMVEVQPINAKLVQRSERILLRLTGRSRDEVRAALERSNGSIKLAILLLNGCSLAEAMIVLEEAGGQLRTALTRLGNHAPDRKTAILPDDVVTKR